LHAAFATEQFVCVLLLVTYDWEIDTALQMVCTRRWCCFAHENNFVVCKN